MIFSVNSKYACIILNVIKFEDKEYYEISCENEISQVQKYPNQSDSKKYLECIYIGDSQDGKKRIFIQDMNDVLSESYSPDSYYPFTILSKRVTPLTHRVFLYLKDPYGFQHIVEALESEQYEKGQEVECLVKSIENGQLVLEILEEDSMRSLEKSNQSDSNNIDFASLKPNTDFSLRQYQIENKEKIYNAWEEYKSVMLQMPTGTGKTRLFVSIVKDLINWGREHHHKVKVLILAHRKELIEQISNNLANKYDLSHGIIMAQNMEHDEFSIQVGSVPTLNRRIDRWEQKQFDVIIIDEAHHVKAASYIKILDAYPQAKVLGVTATPYRLNGRGFQPEFDTLITSASVQEFINKGFLCDYDYYSIKPESLLQSEINNLPLDFDGDYLESSMLKVMNSDSIKANIVKTYQKFALGKKGIVYTVNRAHNNDICEQFCRSGIKAVAIDSTTPMEIRMGYIRKFRHGEIDVICNVNIFSEGFDCPDLEFIQLARPTKSLSLYLQQVGRGFRPAPGKEKLIILDNVGLYNKFGFPSAERSWDSYFAGYDTSSLSKTFIRESSEDNERFVHDIEEGDETVELLHPAVVENKAEEESLVEDDSSQEQSSLQNGENSETMGNIEVLKQIIDISKKNELPISDEVKSEYAKLLHQKYDNLIKEVINEHFLLFSLEGVITFTYKDNQVVVKQLVDNAETIGKLNEIEKLISLLESNNFSIPEEVTKKHEMLSKQRYWNVEGDACRDWLQNYFDVFNASAVEEYFQIDSVEYLSKSDISIVYKEYVEETSEGNSMVDNGDQELENTCSDKTYTNYSGSILSVQLGHGRVIQESTSIGTFIETIKFIGWKRVRDLNIKVYNDPFIVYLDTPKKDCRYFELAKGWYFKKVLSNEKKYEILKEIISKLHLPYTVNLIQNENE